MPTNKTDKKQIVSTQITAEEKERLQAYCTNNDETISRVLRKALKEYLDRQS